MKKKTERQKLIKLLDDLFSKFIRIRDSDEEGYGKCITCGKVARWKTMDCGHYQKRQHMATRWEEKNCAIQCKPCNGFEQGKDEVFGVEIDKKWGKGTSEMLKIKAHNTTKYDEFALRELIKQYAV